MSLDLFSLSYVITSLGSITDTFNYYGDFTYINNSPLEDRDVGKLRTIDQEALLFMWGFNLGWKASWDSKPERSCLILTIE
jgi:hypothetical protein